MTNYRVIIGDNSIFGLGSPVSTCGVMYVAFHENESPITEEHGRVLFEGDSSFFNTLQRKIKKNSVLSFIGEKKGQTIQVKGQPEYNVKAMGEEVDYLAALALPVTFTDPQFGEFILNKRFFWFEGSILYKNKKIHVTLANKEQVELLRKIAEDFESFFRKAEKFAAYELDDLANEWCYEAWSQTAGENDVYTDLTKEDFIKNIELLNMNLSEDDAFYLYYNDGNMFLNHAICVHGSLACGFLNANIEG